MAQTQQLPPGEVFAGAITSTSTTRRSSRRLAGQPAMLHNLIDLFKEPLVSADEIEALLGSFQLSGRTKGWARSDVTHLSHDLSPSVRSTGSTMDWCLLPVSVSFFQLSQLLCQVTYCSIVSVSWLSASVALPYPRASPVSHG